MADWYVLIWSNVGKYFILKGILVCYFFPITANRRTRGHSLKLFSLGCVENKEIFSCSSDSEMKYFIWACNHASISIFKEVEYVVHHFVGFCVIIYILFLFPPPLVCFCYSVVLHVLVWDHPHFAFLLAPSVVCYVLLLTHASSEWHKVCIFRFVFMNYFVSCTTVVHTVHFFQVLQLCLSCCLLIAGTQWCIASTNCTIACLAACVAEAAKVIFVSLFRN